MSGQRIDQIYGRFYREGAIDLIITGEYGPKAVVYATNPELYWYDYAEGAYYPNHYFTGFLDTMWEPLLSITQSVKTLERLHLQTF